MQQVKLLSFRTLLTMHYAVLFNGSCNVSRSKMILAAMKHCHTFLVTVDQHK